MNARTEFQIIVGKGGRPAVVAVPYDAFRRMKTGFARGAVPHDVVDRSFERAVSPMAVWREHLARTQAELAAHRHCQA